MKKQLKDYKWIIGTGCSYGRMLDSIKSPFIEEKMIEELGTDVYEFNDSIIGLNVSVSSQGAGWQSDSAIYIISKLLEIGVPSNNIYCFIEWSQWSRLNLPLPQFMNLDINKLNLNSSFAEYQGSNIGAFLIEKERVGIHINEFVNDVDGLSEFINSINIGMSKENTAPYNISQINNFVYLSANHVDSNLVSDYCGIPYSHWIEESQIIENSLSIEYKLNSYLDNILKTQWFLKSNNIKYNCIHMQGDFTGWNKGNDGIIKHEITHSSPDSYIHPYLNLSEDEMVDNPEFRKTTTHDDIETVFPELKHKFDMIDFSNFWYYESDKFRRGGVDEWAMDIYKERKYNQHPPVILYMLLWNTTTSNCEFLKFKNSYIKLVHDLYFKKFNPTKIYKQTES